MLKRKRFEEAKSLGFYLISAIFFVLVLVSIMILSFTKPQITISENLITSIIAAAGAMLAVSIAVFTLYFNFSFSEHVKSILLQYGFYFQLPRDMLRSASIFGICIFVSIVSFFVQGKMNFIIDCCSILCLLYGISVLIYATIRFLKIIKLHLSETRLPK